MPTDLDGVVKINGHVLVIEQKRAGGFVSGGQARTLRVPDRFPDAVVGLIRQTDEDAWELDGTTADVFTGRVGLYTDGIYHRSVPYRQHPNSRAYVRLSLMSDRSRDPDDQGQDLHLTSRDARALEAELLFGADALDGLDQPITNAPRRKAAPAAPASARSIRWRSFDSTATTAAMRTACRSAPPPASARQDCHRDRTTARAFVPVVVRSDDALDEVDAWVD